MSATNSTPTINLPLFIGTDKPAWLTDWNGSMNAIDSAIATLQTAEGGTATALASLSQSVTALSGTVEQHTTAIQTVTTATATNTGSINTITSLIGNGEPTTEDKTIIGAINEIYADQGDLSDLTTPAASLVAAINAVSSGGAVAANEVSYDNTSSGLVATNVQAAIDELKTDVDTVESAVGSDIVVDTVTSSTVSLSPTTSAQVTIDATKTGYTPVGIVGVKNSLGYGTIPISEMYIENSNVQLRVRNIDSSSFNSSFIVNVLYKKN